MTNVVEILEALCEDCGERHLTQHGHPACPGHIRNGQDTKGNQLKPIGAPCAHELGWGTVHPGFGLCKLHGGSLPTEVAAARVEMARAACNQLGLPVEGDPGEILMGLVHEWNGNVAFYRTVIQLLPTYQEDDVFTPSEAEDAGEWDGHWGRADPVLVGRTYHQSGVPTGQAERSIYLRLYEEACDRLAKYCEMALKAGVEERRLRLDEAEARRYFDALVGAMSDAGLTQEQAEVFRRAYVRRIDPGRTIELDGPSTGEPALPA